MVPISEYFRSVEWIWAIWIVSVILLVVLTRHILRAIDFRQWTAVFRDEDGAAYSLSYVLVFPIYLLLVMLVIQVTFILIVKLGTVYAAYAAARSQIVWNTMVDDRSQVNEKSRQAAVQVMAGYSTSWNSHLRQAGVLPSFRAEEYFQIYRTIYNASGGARRVIVNKYRWAEWATNVSAERKVLGEPWIADIKATVTYKMPFHIPAIGRFMGRREIGPGGSYFVIEVTSSATLQDEAPQNNRLKLGLQYESR